MLGKAILLKMFQYNYDTNNRLLALAENVTPDQWIAPQAHGQRSLHETLFHILAVEEEWLILCAEGKSVWDCLPFADHSDPATLRALSDRVYATFRPYLENTTEEQLQGTVHSMMPQGVMQTVVIWQVLLHMLYHSAQHRSEAAFLLTGYGHSPGFIDFYGSSVWEPGD